MIDTTKLRELAEKAPSGKWETWASCSWRRVYAGGQPAITPCVQRYDNHPDLTFAPGVREWIEVATPDAILALLDRLEAAERALQEIAEQEHIELMLDPTWAQRVASAAIQSTTEPR